MEIREAEPPVLVKDRCSYKEIMQRLQASDGKWLCLKLDEVAPGEPNSVKQSRLWMAARNKGMKIQTTVQGDSIYIREIREAK
jgi:hypothetical protein